MLKMLPSYAEHVSRCPHTLLTRALGLYSLGERPHVAGGDALVYRGSLAD